jgi:hypothetical protein
MLFSQAKSVATIIGFSHDFQVNLCFQKGAQSCSQHTVIIGD